jgi:NDP-sugar pyrophosphorylase family protein
VTGELQNSPTLSVRAGKDQAIMKAVVLAGGQEFGQCPLSRQAPRALWPLADKPIIQHVLESLVRSGIGDAAVSANGRTHDIMDRLGRQPFPGISIYYSEDSFPRGAAGCIKDCEEWLGNETFVVVHGAGLLIDVDFDHLIAEHRSSGAAVTVAAEADDDDSEIRPSMSLKPTGIYVCEPSILAHIKKRGYQDMKEQLIPKLIQAGLKVRAVPMQGRVISIRNEECYLNAMVEIMDDERLRRQFTQHLDSKVPGIWIDASAEIDPTARIVGPAYVGPGAKIGADAVVIGPAVIGPDCRVERDAVIHESILWRGARVGQSAMVEQTVMAADSLVSAGAEVRGSIVVETSLSAAERQSLSGSMDLDPVDVSPRRWWRRIWNSFGPAARPAV